MQSVRLAVKVAGIFAALVMGYFVVARIGLVMAPPGSVSPVCPVVGIAIAALALLGLHWCPAIMLGALWAFTSVGRAPEIAFVLAVINMLEAMLGAVVLRRLGVLGEIAQVRDSLILLAVALLIPLLSATAGVCSLWLIGMPEGYQYAHVWMVWWVGHSLGALFLTPMVLAWCGSSARKESPARTAEAWIVLAIVVVAAALPFVAEHAWSWLGLERMPVLPFLLLPLIWAALRLRPRWTTLALEITMAVAVWNTARRLGPFANGNPIADLVMLQMVMAGVGGAVLVLIGAISERDRHAEVLATARDLAEGANLAKSQFVAALGHDMKQPLQASQLFLGALKERQQEPKGQYLAERIDISLGAMGAALDSLKDITSVECGVVTPRICVFPVAELLDQLASEYRLRAAERGLAFRYVHSTSLVKSDRQLLARVLRNLLSNAVRYTSHGRLLLGCRRDPGGVRIEVWDTGAGIAADEYESIFLAFHRGKGAAQKETPGESGGLGLGLATVHRLASALGLAVAVRSTVGKGSGFSVVVPAPRSGDEMHFGSPTGFRGWNGGPQGSNLRH
jgi:signal transduction histidine kinase